MYIISSKVIWIPFYLAIIIALGIKYKRKLLVIIIMIIIAITINDQISLFLKNEIHRLRPCHEPALEGLVHLVKGRCGSSFGFVSSHASNSFTAALLGLLLIRRRWFTYTILIWALVVGYSRIYLGVHYPGDVLCGAILGSFIGWMAYNFYELTDRRLLSVSEFFNKE
jgi:undecaprenyl-diphosphatase